MRRVSFFLLAAAVTACGNESQTTEPLAARQAQLTSAPQYTADTLPTIGGRLNRPSGISNRGWVAGFVNRASNATRVAALWRDGEITELALDGPNSNVLWPGVTESGIVAGFAEIAALDTLGEAWSCSAFLPTVTGHLCRGFVYDHGVVAALPTLGGDNGFAAGVNNRGQVVGWAETPVVDPTCNAPQVLQFRAVLWEPRKGTKTELPPLPGDSTSAATAINDSGVAVGISGECDVAVGQRSAQHSVLWYQGQVTEIGDLGGDMWHTPMDINEQGDVVGFSNPATVPGITFAPHGFLWTKSGGIVDLLTLPGDATSQAVGINADRLIVGVSSGPTGNRAVLWLGGGMPIDLNTLVTGFPHRLIVAQHINDRGVIVARATITGTTRQVPVVLTPIQ